MGISANSYFSLWFFLEINIIVFIYLIYLDAPESNWELLLKYFIIQSLSSILFLGRALILACRTYIQFKIIIISRVLIKLGSAPFHWWVVDIANKSSWAILLLLTTIQKILPIALLDRFIGLTFKRAFILANFLIGVILIYQVLLKRLLVYSRIFNLGWIIIISRSFYFWKLFSLYLLISIIAILSCSDYSVHTALDLTRLDVFSKTQITIQIFNLSGLPPFPGFFLKLFVIRFFMTINLQLGIVIFLILSALRFFGYLKLILNQILRADYFYFNIIKTKINIKIFILMFIALSLLVI